MNSSQRLSPDIKTKAIHQMWWRLGGVEWPIVNPRNWKGDQGKGFKNWKAGKIAPKAYDHSQDRQSSNIPKSCISAEINHIIANKCTKWGKMQIYLQKMEWHYIPETDHIKCIKMTWYCEQIVLFCIPANTILCLSYKI